MFICFILLSVLSRSLINGSSHCLYNESLFKALSGLGLKHFLLIYQLFLKNFAFLKVSFCRQLSQKFEKAESDNYLQTYITHPPCIFIWLKKYQNASKKLRIILEILRQLELSVSLKRPYFYDQIAFSFQKYNLT